jgi:hypothetical protein
VNKRNRSPAGIVAVLEVAVLEVAMGTARGIHKHRWFERVVVLEVAIWEGADRYTRMAGIITI